MALIRNIAGISIILTSSDGLTLQLPKGYYGFVEDRFANAADPTMVFVYPYIPPPPTAPPSDPGAGHIHPVADITGFDEAVEDRVAALIEQGDNVELVYNDTTGTLRISAVGAAVSLGDENPEPLGTASPGVANTAAREDHVHPMPTLGALGGAAENHTHSVESITDLAGALSGKAPVSHTHTPEQITGLDQELLGKADALHTHTVADVTGLTEALGEKADSDHTHGINDVSGLQTALNGKAAQTHSHSASQITDLDQTVETKIVATVVAGSSNVHVSHDTTAHTLKVSVDETPISFANGTPKPLGTANPGSSASPAREDHVHKMPSLAELGAAPLAHTHTSSQITDFVSAVDARITAAGGVGGGGGGPTLSDELPADLGTAAPGESTEAARSDHVHDLPTAAQIPGFDEAVDTRAQNPDGQITLPSDPVNAMHAATKQYVDAIGSTSSGTAGVARRDSSGNLFANTFQGTLVGNVSNSGNNTGQSNIQLNALTNATAGAPVQMPPRQRFQGRVWDTTSLSSKTIEAYEDFLPISGPTTALSGQLRWRYSVAGGTVVTAMTLDVATGTLTPVGPISVSVTPTDNTHVTNKLYVDKARFSQFNVKAYGAFGDGSSHPLSSVYANLAAAQVVYPFATSLTQEIDWCAAQKAINEAGINGGRVVFDPGRYIMSDELIIPHMANTDDGNNAVDIMGSGMRNTILEWPTDLGANKFAIRPQDRVNSYVRTKISDLHIYGPRDTDALGMTPANMDGLGVGHRFVVQRVCIEWFHAGVNIVGDHSHFLFVECSKNFYGVYWGNDATNRGDHNFTSCDINGNKYANLAIHAINTIDAAVFTGCHLGFAPWGIYIETGTRTLSAMSNTTFTDCSFEAIGNGIVGLADAPDGYNGIVTTVFTQCSGTQIDAYKLASTSFTAWVMCNVDRSFFLGGHGIFGSHQSIPTALFNAKFTNSAFEDFRDLTYLSSSTAFAKNDVSGSTFKRGNVSGFISYVYDDACVAGSVLGHWYEAVGAMRANSMVAGMCLNTAPSTAQVGLIATTGFVEAKKTAVAIDVNSVIQASTTYGSVETGVSGTRPIVGIAKFGAGAPDATVWMWVQITHRM